MYNPPPTSQPPLHRLRAWNHPSLGSVRTRGVALVMVLAFLVIISILTVAFLQSVRTDLRSSKSYAGGVDARILADTALNTVIGQIQEGTQRPGEAWISQPGLIRTFTASGQPSKAFKLYSADRLIEDNFNPAAGTDIAPANWRTLPNLYTDLNAPTISEATTDYPDGAPHFPILDPRQRGLVEGFDAPTEDLTNADGEILKDSGENELQAIPMPVKWLYILKDGSLASAAASGDAAKLSNLDGTPTDPNNPAVSRIAFWTDDDSAKLNINTAGEGTFWDTPVANTFSQDQVGDVNPANDITLDAVYELDLAQFQASQYEYQRYSGHPATTSLSPVFGESIRRALGGSPSRKDIVEELIKMTPRYVGGTGSSLAGTRRASASLTVTPRRLYASMDEFLFTPQRPEENKIDTAGNRAKMMDQARFFITAHSSAPEVTLFNTPRVASWPVPLNPANRTNFDKLIAFCSTVGGQSGEPFYFTRSNALSQTADFTPRNAAIYGYLQGLTSRQIPGIGGSTFADKYPAPPIPGIPSDRDQILTQIFDYLRTVNMLDVSDGSTNKIYTGRDLSGSQEVTYRGIVLPIQLPNGTRGFGRVPTLAEVVLVTTLIDLARPSSSGGPYEYEVALLPALHSPMAGFPLLPYNIKLQFENLDRIKINGQSPFDSTVEMRSNRVAYNADSGQAPAGGIMGMQGLFKTSHLGGLPSNFPPIGRVPASTEPLTISSDGPITIRVSVPHDGPEIQRFDLEIPTATINRRTNNFSQAANQWTPTLNANTGGYIARLGHIAAGGQLGRAFGRAGSDISRSLTATGLGIQGDIRLVAASSTPGSFFIGHRDWDDPAKPFAISVREGWWHQTSKDATFGALVEGVTNYSRNLNPSSAERDSQPYVPPKPLNEPLVGVRNSLGQPGDWDNGQGLIMDGPFLNKVDEGVDRSMQTYSGGGSTRGAPYIGWRYSGETVRLQNALFFSPNRQMPSPVMFGSLPTGVKRGLPWQTLLFRPATLINGVTHPGGGRPAISTGNFPADHLLLDLFWMPVVEPYAISEPFATAGKINLNTQIVPFTQIKRNTGLYGVIKSVELTAIDPHYVGPSGLPFTASYKLGGSVDSDGGGIRSGRGIAIRRPINVKQTLRQIEQRLADNKPFISASEICDIPLIPGDLPGRAPVGFDDSTSLSAFPAKLEAFWETHKLTGDNSLERPYAYIYPRLTTKSNTFTVHVRAQSLTTSPKSAQAGEFDDASNAVNAEFRGSFVIERYLDPNTQSFDGSDPSAVLGPYKIRVVETKQLAL